VHPTAATPTVRIEARIRVPQGLGLWAAFWALPEDPNRYDTCSGCGAYGGWPASGELDIMEAANRMQMVSQHAACCA
jgi:beta-glucanase (GH16 family)